ncbi:MAG: DUF559 domain-containing protein [Chloroflexi bacterium]|nr:DUF559 domain-containing protein [Chloroflexota bacterium]
MQGSIIDFYCHKAKLVIEVDGDIHDTPSAPLRRGGVGVGMMRL